MAAPRDLSPRRLAARRFKSNRGAMVALLVLSLVGLAAILAPVLATHDVGAQDLVLGSSPPSANHLFGTDFEGRDLFSRTLFGARLSLLVGLVATAVALLIGVTYGAIAGYFGGRVDQVMMRIVDVLYGLPYMFFVIILMVWSGRGLMNIFIGLGAVSWLTMARIVRGNVLSLRERDFVLSARASGVSSARIIIRHVLPNIAGPVIIYGTLTVPRVMIEEAFLSFLGLGVQPPFASWGSLLSEGSSLFREASWLLLFPALAFCITLLALNLLGDGLRDALDPKGSS